MRRGVIFLVSNKRVGALRTRGESTDNKEENENMNKGPFTKFIHFTRVSMDKKEENKIFNYGTIHKMRPLWQLLRTKMKKLENLSIQISV